MKKIFEQFDNFLAQKTSKTFIMGLLTESAFYCFVYGNYTWGFVNFIALIFSIIIYRRESNKIVDK